MALDPIGRIDPSGTEWKDTNLVSEDDAAKRDAAKKIAEEKGMTEAEAWDLLSGEVGSSGKAIDSDPLGIFANGDNKGISRWEALKRINERMQQQQFDKPMQDYAALQPQDAQIFGPLMGSLSVSGGLLLDDLTGIGVADDWLIPLVLGAGVLATGVVAVDELVIKPYSERRRFHGTDPEGKTGKGPDWQRHSGRRSGERYNQNQNKNRGDKNKKYIPPRNQNKQR